MSATAGRWPGWARSRWWGLLLALACSAASALTCTSVAGTNNWNVAATWTGAGNCNRVPLAGDDVVISAASTTTLNANSNALASLTVNGTLIVGSTLNVNSTAASSMTVNGTVTIGNNNTARVIDVNGSLAVAGVMAVLATSTATHTLTLGGSLTNTGTVNFGINGAGGRCNVTFNGTVNQTVSGTVRFNLITINNTGGGGANIVEFVSPMVVPAPFLTITNGVYKHSNATNITPWTAAVTLPAAGGFWLNGAATVTMNSNITLNGLLRVDAGTLNVGNANNENIILNNNAATAFEMNGGAVNIAGRLTSSAVNGTGTFTLTGGTLTVGTVGNTLNNALGAPFFIGSATQFNQSGGTIVIQEPSTRATPEEYDVRAVSSSVTGGTLQIGNASTAAGMTFRVGSVAPVFNFFINGTNNPTATLRTGLTVYGDWTNDGSFTAAGNTVTFALAGAQTIGGASATTFAGLTMNKSAAANTVTVATSPTVTGTLTFTLGRIVTGGNLVTVSGTIASPSANSYVVGNFRKSYVAGAAFNYFAGDNFPIGDATNYTPVSLSAGTTSTAGSLTASTTSSEHPNTASGANPVVDTKSVNRYWTLANTTLNGSFSASFTYIDPADRDGGATPASMIVARGSGCTGAGPSRNCPVWSRPTLIGTPSATVASVSGVTVASGDGEADFCIGEFRSVFAREKEFIYTRERY